MTAHLASWDRRMSRTPPSISTVPRFPPQPPPLWGTLIPWRRHLVEAVGGGVASTHSLGPVAPGGELHLPRGSRS